MARYQSLISITLLCTILVIINSTTQVMCHTKGLRPGRHVPINPFPDNSTRTQLIEKRFLKWVQFIGGLDHSIFKQALNKLFPSYSITVDKNPAAGDFTSIQAALDSLPLINLVRVVIKVNAGTYTEKVSVSAMRAFVTIQGAGADKTVVQWGDTADTLGSRGQTIGTFNSATFAVNSAFFIARNITFKVVYAYLKQSNCNAVS